jgi:hypothetical protein
MSVTTTYTNNLTVPSALPLPPGRRVCHPWGGSVAS